MRMFANLSTRPLDLDKTSRRVGVLVSREGSARKAQGFRVTLSFLLLSAYQTPSLYAIGHEEVLRAVGGMVDQTRRHRSNRRFRLRSVSSCLTIFHPQDARLSTRSTLLNMYEALPTRGRRDRGGTYSTLGEGGRGLSNNGQGESANGNHD
jgi:hypothetical protein